MSNATSTQLQELYVAYFGRAADPAGLDYWTDRGITTRGFAANMYAQKEFVGVFGDSSVSAQVNQLYKNLFDREADVDGLLYWTKQIDLGKLQLAEIAVNLIHAAQNNEGGEADKLALANRAAAAEAYTAEIRKSTAGILAYQAESTDPWIAGSNITEAKTYLAGINGETEFTEEGVTASVAAITTAGAPSTTTAGKAYTLTASTDTLTGDSGNDSFTGTLGTDATLNSGDTLDGSTGTDTARISSAGAAAVTSGGFKFSNIETISVTGALNTVTDDTTINLASSSGYTKIVNDGSSSDLLFTNVGTITPLSLEYTAGTGITSLTYNASVVEGTETQEITLVDAGSTGLTTADDIETFTITASGTSSIYLDADSATSVTVNASGTTTIDLNAATTASIGTVDGSGSTGDVTYVVDFTDVETSVTGGTGDDTINVSDGAPALNDVIDGGDGSDTLYVASTGAADVASVANSKATISNVEVLSLRALDGTNNDTMSVDMDNVEGITSIKLNARDVGTANTFNLNDLTVDQAAAVSLSYSATAFGATVNYDIKDGVGTADKAAIDFTSVSGAVTTVQDASDTLEELTVTVGAYAGTTTLTLAAADFDTKLTVSGGSEGRTLDMDGSAITPDTIDASGVVGNLLLSLGADTQSVTTGSGDDLIAFGANYTNADSISAGAGTDTVRLELSGSLTTALNITDVEKVDVASAASTATVNASGITTFNVVDTAEKTDSVIGDVISLLNFSGTTIGFNNSIQNGAQALNAVTIANGFSGTADALTIAYDGDELDGSDSSGATTIGDLIVTGIEDLTMTFSDYADTGVTLGNGSSDGVVGSSLKTITVTGGTSGLEFDMGDFRGSSAGSINTVDLTGLAGNVTLEVDDANDDATVKLGTGTNTLVVTAGGSSTSGVTITGNTGADTVTATTLADTADLGAGADSFTGGGNTDTVTTGAGADTVVFSAATTDTDSDGVANATTTVTDFTGGTGGDIIHIKDNIFSGYAVTTDSAAVTLVSVAIADALAGTNVGLGEEETSKNYVVYDTAANIIAGVTTSAAIFVESAVDIVMAIANDTGAIYSLADPSGTGGNLTQIVQVGTLNSGMGSLVAANLLVLA